MTLQEILKSQGLSDEQVDTIIGEMKQNKIYTTNEENLDIRYSKLKAEHDNLTAQYGESSKLIEQLKAGTKDSEALQAKIASYEQQNAALQAQLKQTQIDAAIQVALLSAKALDVDYLTFKLKEKGDIELDADGKIKGIDDRLAGLRTQFPNQFDTAQTRAIEEQRLPNSDDRRAEPQTLADAIKSQYENKQ